jgi:nucleotide-binding universal stress UspA family protein
MNVTAPRTIIVPLDGSEFAARALPVARALAGRIGSDLIVMSTAWDGGVDGLGAYLARVAGEPGYQPTEVLLVDEHPASRAIASVSQTHPNSVVCMTSHGRNGPRWAVLGSVTGEVLREARVPMLVVGRHSAPDWPGRFAHIVVCVDGSSAAQPDFPSVCEWAEALGLDVHVVLVSHPLEAAHPDKVLDAVTARFVARGLTATSVPRRGSSIAGTIADYAGTLPATLVALNTAARGGIARSVLRSVAMDVVSLAPCPVLISPSP